MIDKTGFSEPYEKSNLILFFAKQRDVADLVWRVVNLADGAVFLACLAMHAVAHREARHVGISTHNFQKLLAIVCHPWTLDFGIHAEMTGFQHLCITTSAGVWERS